MADIPVRPEISVDMVCRIIVRAREFDVKEAPSDEQEGSNPADDGFIDVLEANRDDPVFMELKATIDSLDVDAQSDLVALAWVGRGDYGREEWREARTLAQQEHNTRVAAYLLGMPLLGDYLEEGLAEFDLSCEDFDKQHF
ncbi:MAG: DUF3775 domain-containing protein [Alphaproteobacteria bacterium]|nr:DUF3775 domain-containing protein [Alphaproteobacteria bacterium]